MPPFHAVLADLDTLKDGFDGGGTMAPTQTAIRNGRRLLDLLDQDGVDCSDMQAWPTDHGTVGFSLRRDKDNEMMFETGDDGISALIWSHGILAVRVEPGTPGGNRRIIDGARGFLTGFVVGKPLPSGMGRNHDINLTTRVGGILNA